MALSFGFAFGNILSTISASYVPLSVWLMAGQVAFTRLLAKEYVISDKSSSERPGTMFGSLR